MNRTATRNHLTLTLPVVEALVGEMGEQISCGAEPHGEAVSALARALAIVLTQGDQDWEAVELIEEHAIDALLEQMHSEPGDGRDVHTLAEYLIGQYC